MKNGLAVESIRFPDGRGIIAKKGKTLETLNEFHAQYDDDWIIEKENGIEVARHNPKYIESIIWEKHDPFLEKESK